ncbi:MAG: hypothetical protein ACJ74Q_15455 [Pyrinomonadaceae bacterium]
MRGARDESGSAAAAGGGGAGWVLTAAAGILLCLSPWHGLYFGVALCAVVAAVRATAARARVYGASPSAWGVYLVGLGGLSAVLLLLLPWVREYAGWVFIVLQLPLALAAFLSSSRPLPSLSEIALDGSRGGGGAGRRRYARVVRRELERAVINHCSVTGQPPPDFLAGKSCDDVLAALQVSRDDLAREVSLAMYLVDRHCVTGAFDGLVADRGFASPKREGRKTYARV